jgi:uncharacterized protein YlzI (FlbEa/FlbD family)
MIQLTRLRQNTPFILNPDHIERVDTHVDTVVRLTNGIEYLVNETGEEIVRRTAEFRARVLALAGLLQATSPDEAVPETATSYQSPQAAITVADRNLIEAQSTALDPGATDTDTSVDGAGTSDQHDDAVGDPEEITS